MNNATQDRSEFNVIFVHSALDDYPLTPDEFRVYGHVARRAGDGDFWEKHENAAERCNMGLDRYTQALSNLVSFKMLTIQSRPGKTNVYNLTKRSLWVSPERVAQLHKLQRDSRVAKRRGATEQPTPPEIDPPSNSPVVESTPPEIDPTYPPPNSPPEGYPSEGNPFCSSSAPQKAKDLDPSQLLPSSELLGGAGTQPKTDPLMFERTLHGAYLFSFKDLRSFSAAHEAAASLITLDPELWRWLVDLRRKSKTNTDTFSSYSEDVLTHVDTYGAERVKAALKYTVQKPDLRNPWTYFLDRVTRDIAKPSQPTDRVSSNKFSGRGGRRDYRQGAERLRQKYSDV